MDKQTFERLAQEHFPALYSFCFAQTCDPHRAEELAQEALCRAFLSLDRMRNPEAFRAWTIGIARRCAWTWFRGKKTDPLENRANQSGSDPPETIADPQPSPQDRLQAQEKIGATLAALKKISFRNREVVILRYFENLSYAAMAERLGITLEAVDRRLTRAKLKLKNRLNSMEF